MKTKAILIFLLTVCIASYSQTPGSFTVGGSSSSYYPVLFSVSGINTISSMGKINIFRDDVHANGSGFGSFYSSISFISSNWGHIETQINEFSYIVGFGTPYNDPIGDIIDGSRSGGGSQLVVWLKGGATYRWSAPSDSQVALTDGNIAGIAKTSASNQALSVLTAQSDLVLKAKNNTYYASVGLGTTGNGYFGGSGYFKNNICIGTSMDNGYKLNVNGSVYSKQHIIDMGTPYTQYLINGSPSGIIGSDAVIFGGKATDFGLYVYGNNTFDISTNTSKRLTVLGDGNVGIGTTTPDHLLTVKGTIHAREVLVDLNGPLADYVFKPDYSLMSLPELEAFVKTNSHLPEMPSAAEVKEKGLSVGEMQNKLLQKVEELTLYVIELQKTNNQQSAEIKELKEALKK